ncbi:UPF0481 protein At3g47200-like [Cicer arietinum]|uniref:UPF0481 protein At3g47200-like n=1 Tax=Cicer arietinum TaxID=3827 RepID=A0A1S2Z5R4_CICAR|nr:UPF0481 protein At3g47200-like [Cicer arietinum]
MAALSTTLENKFEELEEAKQTLQNSRPKIQKVAEYLRNREKFKKHYVPKLVSMGPIHHGNENLELGEKYKLSWAAKYIENTKLKPKDLFKRIADNIGNLKSLYAEEVLTLTSNKYPKGFDNEALCWMLFVDGCALLFILEKAKLEKAKDMNIKVDQLVLVMMDVLLLENQLPYLVLKLLWKDEAEISLLSTMKNFLQCHHWSTPENKRRRQRTQGTTSDSVSNNKKGDQQQHKVDVPDEPQPPTHLLDLQRKIILPSKAKGNESNKKKVGVYKSWCKETHNIVEDKKNEMTTYRNIQELRAAGITLKSSKTRRPTDIEFYEGWFAATLVLPEIVVDDTTAITFLNLIAYEMCPDFENDYGICSFAVFMDSLIDHPDDVKELRSQGILLNSLGSDKEVAKLFNILSTDLVANTETYAEVRLKIHEHYLNRCKTWIALGFHTYFDNPWAIIAFLAAVFALVLTFIQTWYAIHPAC